MIYKSGKNKVGDRLYTSNSINLNQLPKRKGWETHITTLRRSKKNIITITDKRVRKRFLQNTTSMCIRVVRDNVVIYRSAPKYDEF